MKRDKIIKNRQYWFKEHCPYKMTYFKDFDYTVLNRMLYRAKSGRGDNSTYNDVIIMADTETSKKPNNQANHIVAWTISMRAFDTNIVTFYGNRPSEFVETVSKMMQNMSGEITYIYFHNLSYDWVFLRRYLINEYGEPSHQLNTKSHYPVQIVFENGLILKDSLILAQRSLNRWANDLDVEHKKAVGKWEYNKLRNQGDKYSFNADELEYIECDTLGGVECLDATLKTLNKQLFSIPLTATGIPREQVKKRGKDNNANRLFKSMVMSLEQYRVGEMTYHGGYTHTNRHYQGITVNNVTAFDFSSSYPYVMLSEKYPCEAFSSADNKHHSYIVENGKDYAFMFKLIATNVRLKNDDIPMPMLQFSKCLKTINAVNDNGRVLCANYIEIYFTEQDLDIFLEQYDFEKHICTEVSYARKDYLPRWFTDYIYELYIAKTQLKGTDDKVMYSIKKSALNSLYGMSVQKNIRDSYVEDYVTGDYSIDETKTAEELYSKFASKIDNVILYQWGIWVTAYAMRNLFTLGSCAKTWIYSDTDSCYGCGWDMEKVNAYNESCKAKLLNNGYGAVLHNNREYWLGIAELDGEYSEYRAWHSKCYCGRSKYDGELHLTLAGVPKCGVKVLNNDIENFKPGIIFPGTVTGKLAHTYIYVESEYIDEFGNETADSIDLNECDYLMSCDDIDDWQKIFNEEIEVQIYE